MCLLVSKLATKSGSKNRPLLKKIQGYSKKTTPPPDIAHKARKVGNFKR